MKKLRMIVTSVFVLVIIGGIFAFKARKCQAFCVDNAPFNGTCEAIITNRFIDPSSLITIHYYNGWNNCPSTCFGPNCTSTVRVSPND
jgi:hypothetical protein